MQLIPPPVWDFDDGQVDLDHEPKPGYFSRSVSQITPQLYLSDYWTARDVQKLEELGITHVVTLLDFDPEIPDCISSGKRLHIDIEDAFKANILQHFETTTAFIVAAIQEDKENKVLVHCMMGISRSATVVCAYLVATTNMTARESIAHVRSIRCIVCPNLGFRQQLEKYRDRIVKTRAKAVKVENFSFSGVASWIRQRITAP